MSSAWKLKTDFKGSPPRPFRRGNGIFYIRLTTGRRDVWRSCHTTVKKEAEAYAYEVWHTFQSSDLRNLIKAPSISLTEAVEMYRRSENFRSLKPSTVSVRLKYATAFLSYCHGKKVHDYDQLTPEFCEAFLSGCGTAAKTFNNVRGDLMKVFEPAARSVGKAVFADVPARNIHRGEARSKPKAAFTDDQIKQILDYIPTTKMKNRDEWIRACRIAMFTGLRFEDIALLRYTDVKDGNILELSPRKTENATGGKKILLRLPEFLQEDISPAYHLKGKYVLPGIASTYPVRDKEGKLVSGIVSPLRPFDRVLENLGIKAPEGMTIGFHSFRVTFVTKLREAGYSADQIRGLVGHTSDAQTEHYNRASLDVNLSGIDYSILKYSVANL